MEHIRDVAGPDMQPAVPAESTESADGMIEGAIRELAADDPNFGPPVSGQPAEGSKPEGKEGSVEEGEVVDDDSGSFW